MATRSELFSSGQSFATLTALAGLANNAWWSSAAVDNSTALYLDALVQVTIRTGASGVNAQGYCGVYAYGSVDGGATYSDGLAGTQGTITPTASPGPNFGSLGSLAAVANATTYRSRVFNVASAFGGWMPDHWGIVIVNFTAAALDTTVGNFSILWKGMNETIA